MPNQQEDNCLQKLIESVCFYKYKTPPNTNNDTGIDSKGKQSETAFMDNEYNYYNYPGNYFGNIGKVQLRFYIDTCINKNGHNSRECTVRELCASKAC